MEPVLKCGEIFRCGPGKFMFSCTYCDQLTNSYSTALCHIETHFQANDINVNKSENIQTVQLPPSNSQTVRKKGKSVLNIKNETTLHIIDIEQNETNTKDCSEMSYEFVDANNSPLVEHIEESVADVQQEPPLNIDVGSFSIFFSDLYSKNPELSDGTQVNSTSAPTQSKPGTYNNLNINKFKREQWGPKIELKTIIECDVCGRQFQRKNAHKHFQQHAAKKRFNGQWGQRILQTKYIQCDICDKLIRKRHSNSHFRKHNVSQTHFKNGFERKFEWGPRILQSTNIECDICGMKIKKANSYSHFRKHTDRNKFRCSTCWRGYCSMYYLKKHMASHLSIKRFNCEICGWQFTTQYTLRSHIRTHTGEKPYKCSMCEKSFAQSSSLHIHLRFHTREKPFKCTLCDEAFITNSRWNDHMRRHNNLKQHKCSYCDRSFFSKGSRIDHERSVHTRERPFECDVCGRTFGRQKNYKQHYFLHTGERLYKCRVCDLTFAQGSSRRSHERSAHKDIAHLLIETTRFMKPITSSITTSLKLEKV